jgi:hypothetical protein
MTDICSNVRCVFLEEASKLAKISYYLRGLAVSGAGN